MNHRMHYRTILSAVRQVAIAACLMTLSSLPAWAQASQVPNAMQQFIGPTGAAYDSGKVFMYVPNTFTKKSTWTGPDQLTQNANPVILNSAGRAAIWGIGSYRQVLQDKNSLQIWDAVTVAPPTTSSVATSGVGDFLAIGAVIPIAGFTAPTNYVLSYGQAISRTTYPDALTALTISSSASCINGNATLTGITTTAQLRVGAPIEASCLSSGTTIATIAGPTSVTVTPVAAVTGSTTVRVFNWGNGDGITTFNVPDFRGRMPPGADCMGGVCANKLTSTYYGVSAAVPGAYSIYPDFRVLQVSNFPPYTPLGVNGNVTAAGTISTPAVTLSAAATGVVNSTAGGSANLTGGGGALLQATITGALASAPIFTGTPVSGGTFTGTPQGGTSAPFTIVLPSVTLNYAIKVLNGTLPTVGVLSLGGMTGDILCGTGTLCTANTISVNALANPSWTATGAGGVTRTVASTLQERGVTLTDYGAVANDSNPVVAAANAVAFANAWGQSSNLYCPANQNFYTTPITMPTGTHLYGSCQIILTGSAGAASSLITMTNTTGNVIEDVTLVVDPGTYPTISGIAAINSNNATIERVASTGIFGVFVSGASDNVRILNSRFTGFYGRAVWATSNGGASSTLTVSLASPGIFTKVAHGLSVGQTVILYTTGALLTPLVEGQLYYVATVPTADTFTLAATSGGAAINTSGSQSGTQYFTANGPTNLTISGNYVTKYFASAHLASTGLITTGVYKPLITNNIVDGTRQWGAACTLGSNCIIDANTVNGSEAECVTSSSAVNVTLSNNVCTFDSTHGDTGLSISNSDGPFNKYVSVTGNVLNGPRNGAMLIGTGAQNSTVSGNTIISPNLDNSTLNAGITLDGSNTTGNFIGPNSFGGDLSHITYQVSEANFTGGGTPSGNYIAQQLGASGTGSYVNPSPTTQMMVRSQSSANSASIYNGFRFESTPFAMRDVGGVNVGIYDYDGTLTCVFGSTASPVFNCGRSTYNFSTAGFGSVAASLTGAVWTLANSAAPAAPAAGKVSLYTDITNPRFHDINSAGVIGTTVVGDSGASNNFLTAISPLSGVITKAQPTIGNLASIATNTVVGNATSGSAAPTALAVGSCSTASSALIWTTNTGFGCNTSITAATATNATNTAITDDTTTNATMFPTWVTANTGNLPQKVTSTKFTLNPSTGLLQSSAYQANFTSSVPSGTFGLRLKTFASTGNDVPVMAFTDSTNADFMTQFSDASSKTYRFKSGGPVVIHTNSATIDATNPALTLSTAQAVRFNAYGTGLINSDASGNLTSSATITGATLNTASNTFTVNGVSLDTAWTSYTPTVTAGSGTFTTVSATGFSKQVGKSVFVRIEVIITTNGTAAGRVEATLPVALAAGTVNQTLTAINSSTPSSALAVLAPGTSTTKVLFFSPTGTYPGGSGVVLNAQGVYEVP